MKYLPKVFLSINRQFIETSAQEANLALYADYDFVNRFRPIAKMLSELTGNSYIDYLLEAQDLILKGESTENLFEYFLTRLARLQAMQEDKQ